MWDAMTARNASTFIWAGDAIYGDDFPNSYNIDAAVGTSSSPRKIQEATPTILSNLYNNLLNDPGYMRLTGRIDSTEDGGGGVRVLGVLDDHDYGTNNGDRTYQHRIESAKLYVEFLQASSSSSSPETRTRHDFTIMERRAAAGLGVYGVKVLDFTRPSGQELLSDAEAGLEPSLLDSDNYEAISLSNQSVAIFLLDCRSHKTPWTRVVPDKFYLDYQGDFLGQEQWTWLNASLSRSHATVNIVVQGLQIHADRYFDGNLVENWSRYPMAQHKLYQTVLNSGANAPILVSGDVHMAELLARHCKRPSLVEKDTKATTPRLLLEVTTSGL